MKSYASYLLFFLFAQVSFASECISVFGDKVIRDIEEDPQHFYSIIEKEVPFPGKKMKEAGQEFDIKDCKRARLNVLEYLSNGTRFKLVFTVDDQCDGGNSFGYVTDIKDKVIAKINDSFIECL
jgi:hypothetical protein